MFFLNPVPMAKALSPAFQHLFHSMSAKAKRKAVFIPDVASLTFWSPERAHCSRTFSNFCLRPVTPISKNAYFMHAVMVEAEPEAYSFKRAVSSRKNIARLPVPVKAAAICEVLDGVLKKMNVKKVEGATDLPRLVEFLLSLAMPPAEVVEYLIENPRLLNIRLDQYVLPIVDYLSFHGVEMGEIAIIIQKNRGVLHTDVDELTRRIDWLLHLGIKPEKLGHVLTSFPPILSYTIENLSKKVDLLTSLDIGVGNVSELIEKNPAILWCSASKLKSNFLYLRSLLPGADVAKMLLKNRMLLSYRQPELTRKVACISRIFGQADVSELLDRRPELLRASVATMERTFEGFLDFFGAQDTMYILRYRPCLCALQWDKTAVPKLEFLEKVIGLEKSAVVECPNYLTWSLDKRIRPRTEALQAAGYRFLKSLALEEAQGDARIITLRGAFNESDEKFAGRLYGV